LLTFGSCCPKSSEEVSGVKTPTPYRSLPAKRNGFIPLPSSCPDDANDNTCL
uniref:Insulin-like growth factor 2 n=1 Tax=Anisakis simplex TaxID=6269 RepID=A0A0M3JGN6_ANISI